MTFPTSNTRGGCPNQFLTVDPGAGIKQHKKCVPGWKNAGCCIWKSCSLKRQLFMDGELPALKSTLLKPIYPSCEHPSDLDFRVEFNC